MSVSGFEPEKSADVGSGTTQDLAGAMIITSNMEVTRQLDSQLLDQASTGYSQGIKEFLAKPYRIRSGVWSGSSGFMIHAIAMPEELLALPIYKNKVDGFLGFRAKLVMRLQVNANKFQQGRLVMSFIPQAQVPGTCPNARTLNIMQVSQLPHVELDVACDTEAVLSIPYISPTTHYNLVDKTGKMGAVYLHQWFPMRYGTGSNTIPYTIWAHFEDVELVTPTLPSTFYSESGITRIRRRRNPTEDEQKSSNIGPIESVFSNVTEISTALAKVPLLSSIAGPVSWVSAAVTRAASHFGWSKPLDESPPHRIRKFVMPMVNNSDASDVALPLSCTVRNKVEVLPGFAGSDLDEMNINYISSVPAVSSVGTWTTSSAASHVLWSSELRPSAFQTTFSFTTADGTVTYGANMTPIAYLSRCFGLWRGSFRFTVKFAKTDFHSGRLLFAFTPGYTGSTDPSLNDTDYLHRQIVDIREGSEYTFYVPFTSTKTWFPVNEAYGKVYLMVMNPLTCPDTVSSTVDWSIQVSMGEDAEFAAPQPNGLCQLGTTDTTAPFVSQSGCSVETGVRRESKSYAPSKFCIGESVSSLLHLLKRASSLDLNTGLTPNLTMWLRPFAYGGRGRDGSNVRVACGVTGDWLSAIAPLYTYNRGGVRLLIVPTSSSALKQIDVRLFTSTNLVDIIDNSLAPTLNARYSNGSSVLTLVAQEGCALVQVPHYNRLHSRLNRPSFGDYYGGPFLCEPNDLYSSSQFVDIIGDANILGGTTIKRSVADDFSFGFFIGVPPMVYQIATP